MSLLDSYSPTVGETLIPRLSNGLEVLNGYVNYCSYIPQPISLYCLKTVPYKRLVTQRTVHSRVAAGAEPHSLIQIVIAFSR